MNTTKVLYSTLLLAVLLISAVSLTPAPRASAVSSSTLAISIDGGVLQFPGETAVFYFTTTANGNVVNPSSVNATIYFPNNVNNLALTPTPVSTGVYMVTWPIPANAVTGFYALVVSATYQYANLRRTGGEGLRDKPGNAEQPEPDNGIDRCPVRSVVYGRVLRALRSKPDNGSDVFGSSNDAL